jgi:hypothetical protein
LDTLRKHFYAIEKQALSQSLQGQHRRRKPSRSWRRKIEVEAEMVVKTWREVKAIVSNKVHWRCFVEAM